MSLAEKLESRVADVVRRVLRELPSDLREVAERVPVFCEWEMADHWLEEGVADDSMGLFCGPALNDPTDPDCYESPRIVFFLAELWDFCDEDLSVFDEESRITYIHELGHYLGLNEAELEARGLL